LTCPNTDTDHSDQSVPVLFAPLFLEGHLQADQPAKAADEQHDTLSEPDKVPEQ
jgi:hypothetical protein